MLRLLAAACCAAALGAGPAQSATAPAAAHAAAALPGEMRAALQHAGIEEDAVSVLVHELGQPRPLLSWLPERPRNPGSLAKLVTTQAALERLGPAWTWATPVWLAGPLRDGVLEGSLHLKGSGDPKLVLERVWLLLRRVQQLGVREIRGDIVLDTSAFAPPQGTPADFDGEVQRPYNVQPAALLLNFRSVIYTFSPDPAAGIARIAVEPALAGVEVQRSVPLHDGPCDDWRGALKPGFEETRIRFAGRYATACGEQAWPLADLQPQRYDARLLQALWAEVGGTLGGRVREGPAPAGQRPSFEFRSPPLAEVVRDINKYSNNVMAEQLALSLAREAAPTQPATQAAARALLRRWMAERLGVRVRAGGDGPPDPADEAWLPNGSGLARDARLSARVLMRLLALSYAAPTMPEWLASLPLAGIDGTLRRMPVAAGRAHLKTGSLRDALGLAGVVHADDGRRLLLVAMINHPKAQTARPAMDALVQWALQAPPRHGHGGPPSRALPR